MNQFEQITFEKSGRVGIVRLNRPEKLNAWTHKMRFEMGQAIEDCNQDPGIGAIVVTGNGKGFCAGADIKELFNSRLEGEGGDEEQYDSDASREWVAFVRQSKPIIAALNGVAVGVGITMVLPCDILIAAESARVGMFFVKMGLVPELASSQILVQRVGFALASEMCLTGRLYSAEDLKGKGFYNRVVPDGELMTAALEMAEQIAANPQTSLQWVKELITANGAETDLALVQKRELALLDKAYASEAHKEAVAAFVNKGSGSKT